MVQYLQVPTQAPSILAGFRRDLMRDIQEKQNRRHQETMLKQQMQLQQKNWEKRFEAEQGAQVAQEERQHLREWGGEVEQPGGMAQRMFGRAIGRKPERVEGWRERLGEMEMERERYRAGAKFDEREDIQAHDFDLEAQKAEGRLEHQREEYKARGVLAGERWDREGGLAGRKADTDALRAGAYARGQDSLIDWRGGRLKQLQGDLDRKRQELELARERHGLAKSAEEADRAEAKVKQKEREYELELRRFEAESRAQKREMDTEQRAAREGGPGGSEAPTKRPRPFRAKSPEEIHDTLRYRLTQKQIEELFNDRRGIADLADDHNLTPEDIEKILVQILLEMRKGKTLIE